MTEQINLQEFEHYGVTSFQLLNFFDVKTPLEELQRHQFVPAPHTHGTGSVEQQFESAPLVRALAPRTTKAITVLEDTLRSISALRLPENFCFNEAIIQQYFYPRNFGISPHRDESRWNYVIALIVFEDGGEFFVCKDKMMSESKLIPTTKGSCILMKGSIPNQKVVRPIHYVSNIRRPRVTLGLRFSIELVPSFSKL